MKKWIACLLALLLCGSAAAEGFSVEGSLQIADLSLSGSLAAGTMTDGSVCLAVSAAELGELTAAVSPQMGLMLRQGEDGPWQQVTVMGYPLTLTSLGTIPVGDHEIRDIGDALRRDLATVCRRMDEVSDSLEGRASFALLQERFYTLIRTGHTTLTGDTINLGLADVLQAYLEAYITGASVTVRGDQIVITLPGAFPDSLRSLELGDLYEQIWRLFVPETGLELFLPAVPALTVTIDAASSEGTVTFTCEGLAVTLHYAADLSAMGYQFDGTVSYGTRSAAFSGTVSAGGVSLTVTDGDMVTEVGLVFGEHHSLTVRVTDGLTGAEKFMLYGSIGADGVSVHVSTEERTIVAALKYSGSLDISVKHPDAALMDPPIFRLNAVLTDGNLTITTSDARQNGYFCAAWTPNSATLTMSRYDTAAMQSTSLQMDALLLAGLITVNGSLTRPGMPTATGTLRIYTAGQYGAQLLLTSGANVRRLSAIAMNPSPGYWQLMAQDSSTGSLECSRSLIASLVTWKDHWRLDVLTDDSADALPAINATLSYARTSEGASRTTLLTLEMQQMTAELSLTAEDGGTLTIAANVDVNGTTVWSGTAEAGADGNRQSLTGTFLLGQQIPITLQIETDLAAEMPAADWGDQPERLELLAWLRNDLN